MNYMQYLPTSASTYLTFQFSASVVRKESARKEESPRRRLRGLSRPALRRSNHQAPLRVGQSGIDATGERTDVVAQRTVGAVDHDRDGRQDERVFCHRLTTGVANHGLTGTDEHL